MPIPSARHAEALAAGLPTGRGAWVSSLVARSVGLFLLVSAGLKLFGLGDVPQPMGEAISPGVRALAAGWEVVLGGWLVVGGASFVPWMAAVATFAAFSV